MRPNLRPIPKHLRAKRKANRVIVENLSDSTTGDQAVASIVIHCGSTVFCTSSLNPVTSQYEARVEVAAFCNRHDIVTGPSTEWDIQI